MGTGGAAVGMRVRRMVPSSLVERVRFSRNPLLLRARGAFGQPEVTRGRVSVIVPIYNVEQYLRECLESIRVQNYPDLEVLMINDGSPDGSAAIAAEFAAADRRFVLITKKNGGLGAARNTGIEHATGEFITFVDSDDAIPHFAYRHMVDSLYRSGSDFVVGGVERWRGKSRRRDQWVTRVHGKNHLGIKLGDLREITMDVFAWNKLFRTEFFRRVVGSFPEGILYEDQEPTAHAYTKCVSFDVLAETTYYWRVRNDRSSITQNKLTTRDITDRIAVARRVKAIYEVFASAEVYHEWLQKSAGFDFGHYYRLSPRGSEEYWDLLVGFAQELIEWLDPEDWAAVPAKERVLAYLIGQGERELAANVIAAQAQFSNGVPASLENGRFKIATEKWGILEHQFPSHIDGLSATDTPLKTGLTRIEWLDSGVLSVNGFAYIDKYPLAIDSSKLRVFATASNGNEILIPASRIQLPEDVPGFPRTSFQEHPEAGFRCEIDPAELLRHPGQLSSRVELSAGAVQREAALIPQDQESLPRILPSARRTGSVFAEHANHFEGLTIRHTQDSVVVSDLAVDGRRIELDLTAVTGNVLNGRLSAVNATGHVALTVGVPALVEGETKRVKIDLPRVVGLKAGAGPAQWRFSLQSEAGECELPFPVASRSEQLTLARGPLAISDASQTRFALNEHYWVGHVNHFSSNKKFLEFSGHIGASTDEEPDLVLLRTDGIVLEPDDMVFHRESGEFTVRFDFPGGPEWGLPVRSATSGGYGLCLVPQESTHAFRDSTLLRFEDPLANGVRKIVKTRHGHAEISDRGHDRSVFMRLRGGLTAPDWSNPQRRGRIESLRAEATELPVLPRTVLCMSFSGSSVHDSPAPLAEAMLQAGLVDEIVWAVNHHGLAPDGESTRTVITHSAEFVELLHRAEYLVNSAHFPHYFRKREGQTYIQTWHGTPLKKIANHVPATSLSDAYRDLMIREVEYWDLLLAQGEWAGELLSSAFDFAGTVLTSGYPRNDSVASDEETQRKRDTFRRRYGIAPDEKVVLYAPTWRDNAKQGITAPDFESLDVARVLEALGDGSRMLIRGHSNTQGVARGMGDERLLDVSTISNLPEIIAASDLLITDYSSIFFDYSLTGKPIHGFVPDLEAYAGSVRGMYFDYQEAFPGTIAHSNDELIAALRAPAAPRKQHDLVRSVQASEQGDAAEKIVEWLALRRDS